MHARLPWSTRTAAVLAVTIGTLGMLGMPHVSAQSPAAPGAAAATSAASAASTAAALSAINDRLTRLEQGLMDLKSRIEQLERKVAGTGDRQDRNKLDQLAKKLDALRAEFQGHGHEYLLEGTAPDGSVQAARQDEFMGRGYSATGRVRIGRPTIGR